MKKYFGIEILRFLTSLSVLIYHYRHFFAPYNSSSDLNYFEISSSLPFYDFIGVIYNHGIFGVHVFYTISGFVFAHIYLSSNQRVTSKNFFVNRFARLYPLHFTTLILVTFLQLFSLEIFDTFQVIQINDLYHFILQIFFISSWGFENGHSFNAPIWSVSVEVAIYIMFFFLLTIIKIIADPIVLNFMEDGTAKEIARSAIKGTQLDARGGTNDARIQLTTVDV